MIDAHSHRSVATLAGQNLNLKASQVPAVDIHRNYNSWRYPATGDISQALASGNQVNIQLTRSQGSGHVTKGYLRFVVTNNTGASVEMVDVSHWIDQISYQDSTGNNIVTVRGDEIFDNLARFTPWDEWKRTCSLVNCSSRYGKGNILQNGQTYTYYLPLPINWMVATGFPIFMINSDLQMFVRFLSSSVTVVNGTAPTLSQFSLELEEEELPNRHLAEYNRMYKSMVHHYFYPYVRRQFETTFNNHLT